MPQVVRGAEHLVSAGELQEGVAVLSRHGHHRAAVAVARSRLPHDSELVTSVMRAWAGQSQADGEWEEGVYHQISTFLDTGTFALAAKCWLAIGRGTEAGECLARLGERAAVRLAAVVTGELSGGTSVLSRVTCRVSRAR